MSKKFHINKNNFFTVRNLTLFTKDTDAKSLFIMRYN